MHIFIETDRLLLREILVSDQEGLYELDHDPQVHTYLGNKPVKHIEEAVEAIEFIRKQYVESGIGRWAMIEKKTGAFVGWAGLKLIKTPINSQLNYYDLGYRIIKRFWGLGYATEAAKGVLIYGFTKMDLQEIYAIADVNNVASLHVLEKCGLQLIENFAYKGVDHHWLRLTKKDWLNSITL